MNIPCNTIGLALCLFGSTGIAYLVGRSGSPPATVANGGIAESRTIPEAANVSIRQNERSVRSNNATTTGPLSFQEFCEIAIGLPPELDLASLRKIVDLQERLAASDVENLLREYQNESSTSRGGLGLKLLLSELSQRDPALAFDFVLRIRSPTAREEAFQAVLPMIAARNPTLVLSLLEQIKDPKMKIKARAEIVIGLTQSAPHLAARQLSEGVETDTATMIRIFRRWALTDFDQAEIAASKLSGHMKYQAIRLLAEVLAEKNPEEAWNFASSHESEGLQTDYQRQHLIRIWAKMDPKKAVAAVMAEPEGRDRIQLLNEALVSWSQVDFKGALAATVALPNPATRNSLLRRLCGSDSQNSKELLPAIKSLPPGNEKSEALGRLFGVWAVTNPQEAVEEALSHFPGEEGRGYARKIISDSIPRSQSPQEALAWMQTHPELKEGSLQSIFFAWGNSEGPNALPALQKLPASERKEALKGLANGWNHKDPAALAHWASRLPLGTERAEILKEAVSNWSNRAPREAAFFVDRLPEYQKQEFLQEVVDAWVYQDAKQAASWLQRQAASPAKDKAYEVLTNKYSNENPLEALAWAQKIQNRATRDAQIEKLAHAWSQRDRAAASAWITKADLPSDTRARLLKN